MPEHTCHARACCATRRAVACDSPTVHSSPGGVLFYNSLQVLQSSRYLYGATDEFRHTRRILDENPEARHIETSLVATGLGRAPTSRRPPGQWLVIAGARTDHCCAVESSAIRDHKLLVTVIPKSMDVLRVALADRPSRPVHRRASASRTIRRPSRTRSSGGWGPRKLCRNLSFCRTPTPNTLLRNRGREEAMRLGAHRPPLIFS